MTTAPYYSVPEAPFETTTFSLVVGSDLVIATDRDVKWQIWAFDSDNNPLGFLANLSQGVTLSDVLPLVVQTARALFPNHLLTEL